ncbi:MAG: hypothetical protein IPH43_14375 [Xanthomonadales bacterium]|nr:hypothetical protein [Xanthomonadales bacterium]
MNLTALPRKSPPQESSSGKAKVSLRANDAQRYVLEGSLSSGEGKLLISGEGGLAADAPMANQPQGAEQFLAADIPAARVVISPDLVIERSSEASSSAASWSCLRQQHRPRQVAGAAVPVRFPPMSSSSTRTGRTGQPLPVTATVTVSLGDQAKLAGYGLMAA